MATSDYHIFTLDNGLRCVHQRTNGDVSYIGIGVNAGSRDESADCQGLAHFVEHTVFKGTKKRRSWHVSNRMESIGGELNAYTSKEETMIYTNAPAGYTDRALELISDIVGGASFPAQELEKEREVVIEEIKSYLDSPSDTVFDVFEDLIYAGSSMGHNILGTPESVRKLNSEDCRRFVDKYYTPSNMVIYCADPSPASRIENRINHHFGKFKFPDPNHLRDVPIINERFDEWRDQSGHQAHTIMGARLFGRTDPRRFPLMLLNNYLAGPCMNSRLNQELREKRGYVYTVDSSFALMSNCGVMFIYFGSDEAHVAKCRTLIERELDQLAQSPIKPVIFDRIKRQYIGQLKVSSDNRESFAMSLGKSLLYFNEVHDIERTTKELEAVTAEDVRAVAELLTSDKYSCLTLL